MQEQMTMFPEDRDAEYRAFVDKFKPKRTTDDCETPENIYTAVAEWVGRTYGLDPHTFIRPFWPGHDYEAEDYPPGCAVVDNPPFSILAKIRDFYTRRGVKFFLFAPTLTMFSGNRETVTYIPCGVQITYANGANVNTSFITNLDDCLVRTAPDLYRIVDAINDANEKARTKKLPKYRFPDHVLTAAAAYKFSHYGVEYRLERGDAVFIRKLDAMAEAGKDSGIFGGAFLLSERAAAERAAAERAAATVWRLSQREWEMVRALSGASRQLSQGESQGELPEMRRTTLPLPMGEVAQRAGEGDPFDLDALMRECGEG